MDSSCLFKIENRTAIKFLSKDGIALKGIKDRMVFVFAEACPSHFTKKNDYSYFAWGKKPLKTNQSSKKIMATIFWDCKGMLLINFKG